MSEYTVANVTKHDQILQYIEELEVGSHISVRQIAKDLEVSEGTAYRAIKEARELGLLVTRERIGTIRVEQIASNSLQHLTFADVVSIVDGRVLGGSEGLSKTLNKFVIGAMTQEAMMSYIDAGSLLIVGNRDEAHHCALVQGAGVLITGGFGASEEIKQLADRYELPLISSSHDTFTVASMINRAMYDRLIKTKMMLVQDMSTFKSDVRVLKPSNTVADWQKLKERTGLQRFPIIDEWQRVIGMITPRDIIGAEPTQKLDKLMTRNPLTVQSHMSVTSAAHMMVWEGIELLPVVDANRKLTGVISRTDVLKAMQHIQNQPQIGETIEDTIWSEFNEGQDQEGELMFHGKVTPQMTSSFGTASEGVLTILITQAAYSMLRKVKKANFVLDNLATYFVRPVQLDSEIEIKPQIIEVSRKFGKVSIEIYYDGQIVCQAMLTAQVIDQI